MCAITGGRRVGRRRTGELLVAYSGARQAHVCPFGQLHLIRSRDGGDTWSDPEVLSDGPLDDRDAGVVETSRRALLVNWFTSLAWLNRLYRQEIGQIDWLAPEVQAGWRVERERIATQQCESADGGRNWTRPHSIGVWGTPAHLLKLSEGRLLLTHGYRREPFGNQARVSDDGGRTWSDPIPISGDGMGADLGYPSSAQLADGTIITVWYEPLRGNPKAVLRQARWRLA